MNSHSQTAFEKSFDAFKLRFNSTYDAYRGEGCSMRTLRQKFVKDWSVAVETYVASCGFPNMFELMKKADDTIRFELREDGYHLLPKLVSTSEDLRRMHLGAFRMRFYSILSEFGAAGCSFAEFCQAFREHWSQPMENYLQLCKASSLIELIKGIGDGVTINRRKEGYHLIPLAPEKQHKPLEADCVVVKTSQQKVLADFKRKFGVTFGKHGAEWCSFARLGEDFKRDWSQRINIFPYLCGLSSLAELIKAVDGTVNIEQDKDGHPCLTSSSAVNKTQVPRDIKAFDDFKAQFNATLGSIGGSEGCSLEKMCETFKQDWNSPMDKYVELLGYPSVLELVKAVGKTVRVEHRQGGHHLVPVATQDNEHIFQLMDGSAAFKAQQQHKRTGGEAAGRQQQQQRWMKTANNPRGMSPPPQSEASSSSKPSSRHSSADSTSTAKGQDGKQSPPSSVSPPRAPPRRRRPFQPMTFVNDMLSGRITSEQRTTTPKPDLPTFSLTPSPSSKPADVPHVVQKKAKGCVVIATPPASPPNPMVDPPRPFDHTPAHLRKSLNEWHMVQTEPMVEILPIRSQWKAQAIVKPKLGQVNSALADLVCTNSLGLDLFDAAYFIETMNEKDLCSQGRISTDEISRTEHSNKRR